MPVAAIAAIPMPTTRVLTLRTRFLTISLHCVPHSHSAIHQVCGLLRPPFPTPPKILAP